MAAARIIHRIAGTGQTVGAVTANLASYTPPSDAAVYVEACAAGRTSAGNSAGGKLTAVYKRVAAAAPVVVGVGVSLIAAADAALVGSVAAIVVSGNDIVLQVTGTAAQTVDWFGEMVVWVN